MTSVEAVTSALEKLGIKPSAMVEHDAAMTVEAGLQAIEGKCPGVFVKNLVVRDKKAGLFLLSVRHDAKVDMKALPQLLGVSGGNFRMADSALMTEKLGVAQA
ncbi:hypothetical protein EMIHUDRAFT_259461, partial [Emiliania huxleyi CCMP1516]